MSRVIAVVAIVLLSPVFALLAMCLMLFQGRPIFFRQTRLGQGLQEFSLVKFRTMQVNDLDPYTMGTIAFEHPIVTPIGKWFRRLRLDEIPQLINIVRGEMVFVGPRPCLPGQEKQMTPEQCERFRVKPGLTGLSEVSGNIFLTQEEQWNIDWRYVQECNLFLDCRILLKTLGVVALGPSRNEEYVSETLRLINPYDG